MGNTSSRTDHTSKELFGEMREAVMAGSDESKSFSGSSGKWSRWLRNSCLAALVALSAGSAVAAVPVTAEDTYNLSEDGAISPTAANGVLANDVDPTAGHVLTAIMGDTPAHGTVTLNGDGSFFYTPVANYNGPDSFTYRARDNNGGILGPFYSSFTTVHLNVAPVNDQPISIPDNYITAEDTPLTINAPGVLGNDYDIDGDTLAASISVFPGNGTVTLQTNGSFVYTPNPGFNGSDGFSYLLNDGKGGFNTATVSINVLAQVDSLEAAPDNYAVLEDGSISKTAANGLKSNDSDVDNIGTVVVVTGTARGTLTGTITDGSFNYQPNPNYFGTDTFTYFLQGPGSTKSDTVTVTLNIVGSNDQPILSNNSYTVQEDTALTIAAPGVLGNDVDPDGDTLTVSGFAAGPNNGSLTLNPDGSFVYTPNPNFNGSDTFNYTATDPNGLQNVASVSITVLANADGLVATDDAYSVPEDGVLTKLAPAGLKINDLDPDGLGNAELVSGPAHGTVTINTNGRFTYTPDANYAGPDSFTYYLNNTGSGADSNVATVSINVVASNDPPDANLNLYVTAENTPLSISAPGVLGNDSDVDGDALVVSSTFGGPSNGTVAVQPNGSFVYTPNANYNGTDTFLYSVSDGKGGIDIAPVIINISAQANNLVAVNDSYSVQEDGSLATGAPNGVKANDVDVDTAGSAVVISNASHGTVSLNTDGSFTYTPAANYNGADSFTYQLQGTPSNSNIATVDITVVPTNDPPFASSDSYVTLKNTALTVAAPGLLANDFEMDGNPLIVSGVDTAPVNGTVTVNADGSFTYTPNTGFTGSDSFVYRIDDSFSGTSLGTVTINVVNTLGSLTAVNDAYSVVEDGFLSRNAVSGLKANDQDADSIGQAKVVAAPVHGSLTVNNNGSFDYTPNSDFSGVDTFTYKLQSTDSNVADSNVATVTITVVGENDAPDANLNLYVTAEDTPLIIAAPGVLGNDTDPDGDTLVVSSTFGGPSNGTVAVQPNGSFIYTPNANFNGTDGFLYSVSDGKGGIDIAPVIITVSDQADGLVAVNDAYSVQEDASLATSIANGVKSNDVDIENAGSAVLISNAAHGTVVLNNDGSFTYSPNSNYNGPDSFTYQLQGSPANSNTATVNLTVVPVNDPPFASDDNYVTLENTALTVPAPGVLANDFEADGDALIVTSITAPPTNGTAVINADGSFTYTPNANYNGWDSFNYLIDDSFGGTDIGTVNINVVNVLGDLVAVNDAYSVVEDGFLSRNAVSGLKANDQDADSIGQAKVVAAPVHGSLNVNNNGSFDYTPNSDFSGVDTFTYKLQSTDSSVADSNLATVTITVVGDNDAPEANANFYVTAEDTPLSIAAPGVLGNDTDPDGDTLVVSSTFGGPFNGAVVVQPNGSFVYTPNANYNGTDSFLYSVSDGKGGIDIAPVFINVSDQADGLVAVNDAYSVQEDGTLVTAIANGVKSNDVDIENAGSAVLISNAAHGTVTLNTDGSFIYTPNANYSGADSFTYQLQGSPSNSNIATVNITVVPTNDPPVAVADNYAVQEDQVLTVPAPGVTINDVDADGDTLAVSGPVVGPTNGSATLNADGSFTYTPNAHFVGVDSFSYSVADGNGGLANGIVSINVVPVSDTPVAVDDNYAVIEDSVLIASALNGVKANDIDPDGTAQPIIVSNAAHGFAGVAPDGSFTYTPALNYSGVDTFTYYLKPTTGPNSNVATVTINVTPVNDPPIAIPEFYTIQEDQTLTLAAPGVLANDLDPDGDTLQVISYSGGFNGNLVINPDGSLTYTPNPNFTGPESFNYMISDGKGGTASTFSFSTINVIPVLDGLVAVDDAYATTEDGAPLSVSAASGLKANDNDVDNVGNAALVSNAAHGVAVVNADGSFTYTPNPNFSGIDTFTYYLDGPGSNNSNVATVSINVVGTNDAPVANDDLYMVAEDSALNIAAPGVLANDSDVDPSDVLTVTGVSVQPTNGIVTVNANGSFVYTPNANYNGTDSFTYGITDGNGGTDSAVVTINVVDQLETLVALDDTYSVNEDDSLTRNANQGVKANDVDLDSVGNVVVVSQPVHGSLTINANGAFNYSPDGNFNGVDTFTYYLNNTGAGADSNIATVTINVAPVNDAAILIPDYYITNQNTTLNVSAPGVLGNDIDADGDELMVKGIWSGPSNGSLSWNADGSFTYVPDANFTGVDSFVYRASDSKAFSFPTVVFIEVRDLVDVPVAVPDYYSVMEDSVLTRTIAQGVKANDYDPDAASDVVLVNGPDHGTLNIFPTGRFVYTPEPDFSGTDVFFYYLDHPAGPHSNITSVTINVVAVNDAPIANEDAYSTTENTTLTIGPRGVLANDVDPEGSSLTAILQSMPVHGTLSFNLNGDGGFSYTPNTGYTGTDEFTYIADDGQAISDVTTVTITIGDTNSVPVANDDLYYADEDTSLTVAAPGVLANDTDDDSVLTVTLVRAPYHGTVYLNPDGSFEYLAYPNFYGEDSFTYQIFDGVNYSNVATVRIIVAPVNDEPFANEDYYSTDEEQPITVASPGVLGNDFDQEGTTLTALLRDNPLHGVIALSGDGSFTYTPDQGYFGFDVFTYNANDGTTNSQYTTVTILVRPINDNPIANDDAYIADEDTTLTVVAPGVLANDTDEDGDTLTATLVLQPLHGTLTFNEDGSFEYLPYPNYVGPDSFQYRASDGGLVSSLATVNITVRNIPDIPVGNPDMYSTQENTPINIPAPGVLANDVDLDGDDLTAVPVDYPTSGGLIFNADGSFTYTPNTGFNGTDFFTYIASDGGNISNLTTVTINVGPVNDVPVANDDLYNVFEDQTTTVSAPGVLANDTDSDVPTTLTAMLINGPLNGTVVLNPDGSFVYTPLPNFNGLDSFTYQANDGLANSNVATVTLNVVPVDDIPLANEDFYVVDEDQSITVAAPGVLGNDSDSDGSVLVALLQQEPPHGQIVLNGDGSFTYTPDPGYSGPDYFVYQANDGVSNSLPTTATITVRPRNDRPTAFADTYVTAEDTPLPVVAPGVLANDTDDDADVLTATLVVPPLHGTLAFNQDGSFNYVPNPNYNGNDSFTYRANDGTESSNEATVTIIITPVQDVPTANNDAYSIPEDTQLVVAAPGVLGDDVDLDNDPLTAQLVDGALNGVVSLNADGSFTYTPNPGYAGTDTFTYKAYDGHTVSNTATVTITVGPVNDVPVANPDVYSLFEDTVSNIAAPGVLQNDTDGDDDQLSATLITGTLNGTVVLNQDGSFTYTPFPNFNGYDYFTYQATDGLSDSNVTTVTLNVVPQQDQPLANPDFYSTTEELPLVVATPGVLGNDFDADDEVLIALLEDNPLHGTVALNGDGSFTYTPNVGFFGTDLFTYRAHDGHVNSDKTTVTITVLPKNDVPVGVDDVYSAVEDTPLNVPAANGVLKNDTDADGDTLTAVLVNQPLHGTVALNGDGSFTYTPNPNFNGQDYFTYRAYDGTEYSAPPSKVVINVAPVQDVPVAMNDSYSIPEDKVLNVVIPGVLGNDYDADNEPLTAHLVDAPQHGIITLNSNGSFSYTPDEDFFGIDTFTYYANDGIANSNLATVTINVGGRNDGPVAVDDNYVVIEDTVLNVPAPGILGNDTDDDGDPLQAVLITPPIHGTLTLNANGSFTYTPFLNYSGPDSFVYRANDGTTLSNPATVSINVITINDAPVLSNAFITSPINENDVATLTADLYDADPADTHLVTVNWGDGAAPTIVSLPAGQTKIFLTHQYLDDNPTGTPVDINAVTLTVQDNNGGNDTENLTVTVNNLAPNFENVSLTQVVPTGGTARLQGTITDVGTKDTFVLTVNWGDGNTQVFNHGPGTSSFDYLHVYAVPGNYVVTVTVQDDDGGTRTITPSVNVRNTADLVLTKTANPDPASVGELLTYTMIVTNNGPDTAHNVILMDTLPSNVEITSSTPHHIPADGVLNWFLGDIPSGQTYRIDLIVKTLQQGPITNVATVVSNDLDPNMANNTAAVTTTIGWLPDGPDLMADAVTVDTICKLTKGGPKCTMKLWALIANRGTKRANACIYSVYLSNDNIFSASQDMKLKTKKLGAMDPGVVKAQRQSIKTPAGFTTTGKFLIVVLDEGNLVFEGNETNNYIIYGPLP